MITHEILKPKPEPTVYRSPQQQHRSFGPNGPWAFGTPQQPQHRAPAPAGSSEDRRLYMDKIEYIRWIEGEVKKKFFEGQLVTINSALEIPGKAPSVVFLVDHIQEICFMAPMDFDSKQPKCIGIKHDMVGPIIVYPPCKLRPLNDEEVTCVHLRNKKTGGTPSVAPSPDERAAEASQGTKEATGTGGKKRRIRSAIVGGAICQVDEDTGEILDEDALNELRAG